MELKGNITQVGNGRRSRRYEGGSEGDPQGGNIEREEKKRGTSLGRGLLSQAAK